MGRGGILLQGRAESSGSEERLFPEKLSRGFTVKSTVFFKWGFVAEGRESCFSKRFLFREACFEDRFESINVFQGTISLFQRISWCFLRKIIATAFPYLRRTNSWQKWTFSQENELLLNKT